MSSRAQSDSFADHIDESFEIGEKLGMELAFGKAKRRLSGMLSDISMSRGGEVESSGTLSHSKGAVPFLKVSEVWFIVTSGFSLSLILIGT